MLVLGGEILSATRLPNKTRLEVLHLPLTDEYIPITEDRGRSKGRFDADDGGNEILDPAILPEGTPVTVIGEITGTAKGTIGETEQEYPTLRIKDLTKWEKSEVRRRHIRIHIPIHIPAAITGMEQARLHFAIGNYRKRM